MATNSNDGSTPLTEEKGWPLVKQQIIKDKIKVTQWAIRLLSIFFTFTYFYPIFGNPYDAYYKVLLSCIATNLLRLHQRIPRISFTMEFVRMLFWEDSFHYLFYAFIFQYNSPITVIVAPIFLFALLHFSSYTLTFLDCLGQNRWSAVRLFISLIEFQSRNILTFCALCEILIMPLTIFFIFTGRSGYLTPVFYYQFLQMRLASRRNPFTRNVYIEITNSLNNISMKPNVPNVLKRIITNFVELMRRMMPIHH